MAAAALLPLAVVAGNTLRGQTVVVTGGGRGIGRALALICAEEGARVALLARTAAEIEAVADEAAASGALAMLVRSCDVTDAAAVDSTIEDVAAVLGGIDVLINNAGGSCSKASNGFAVSSTLATFSSPTAPRASARLQCQTQDSRLSPFSSSRSFTRSLLFGTGYMK